MTALHVPDVTPEDDTLGAALRYAAAGWYVLPVKGQARKNPGSVVGAGWQHQSSRDPEQLAAWFAGSDHGIALHVGRSGGVIADVDYPDKLPEVLEVAMATVAPPVQTTREGDSRRGHYVFAQPKGRTLGNGTGKLGGAWGEIRGQNGVIIVAPSLHVDEAEGGRYRWEQTGPVPVLPDSVAELLHDATLGEDAATDDQVQAFLAEHVGKERPELLDVWCALYLRKVAEGESRHDRMVPVMAGAMKEARAGFFPAAQAAERLRAAFLEAVARPAVPGGKQGKQRTGSTAAGELASILSWAVAAQAADLDKVRARVTDKVPDVAAYVSTLEDVEDWPDPEPLASAPAPVDVSGLPAFLQDIVTATAASVHTPVEVPLVFGLGVLSAATRGCWDVQVTSSWAAGPTSLYGVALADSGERKSAGARPLLAPLNDAERELVRTVNAENRARQVRREAAEARLKQAVKDDDQDSADKLAAIAHENRRRPVPALVLSDTTTEALGVHREEQGGAVALFNTEATAFSTVAGHYSAKGGNVGLLNHAYDAERFADKRIKRAGVTIARPFLAWAAAVQTAVLTGYANGTTEGSGFLARFVLLLPTSMVGARTVRTEAIPAAVQSAWDTAITALHGRAWAHYAEMADDPEDYGDPLTVTLTADAADALLDYAQQLEDAKASDWSLRDLGGWIEKHAARMARIAALFSLAENPYAMTVERRHLDAALSLADAFVTHAKAAMRVLRNTGSTGPVRRLLDVLTELGEPEVSTRDVHYKVRGQSWAETAEDVRDVLQDLEMLGYVRLVEKTGRRGRGRPSEMWTVHPTVIHGGQRGGHAPELRHAMPPWQGAECGNAQRLYSERPQDGLLKRAAAVLTGVSR